MKKLTALILALIMVLSLAACGDSKAGTGDTAKPIKIGVMQFGEFTALQDAFKGFKEGLADAGFVDGQNIKINYLSAAARKPHNIRSNRHKPSSL